MSKTAARKPRRHVLEDLYRVILSRKRADPAKSNTARLFAKGKKKIAQKLGEEAVEAVIDGVRGDRNGLILESADVLYHLLVLWAAVGVRPEEVWDALKAREGISGIAEKASREKD
ncbi:MAG TPA: phosphoribosyl-ATP diphosphatase [Candidatus Cybelea sp.]|nr:phosphoribosyl-ATP diphosphatase [Candidatus Cybelea sp.]